MRRALVLFLESNGIPGFFAPTYFLLAGLGGLLGCMLVLAQTRKDGGDISLTARALFVAYICALLGGDVFEILRRVPQALAEGSLHPVMNAGRAAYGGLIGSILAALIYLRWKGQPVGAFFDRVSLGAGFVFAVVRSGCFLEGCDYGRVTPSLLGVRFPVGSPAANDHAALGWVPEGAASLPVHATQLYESGVGLMATAIAYLVLRRGHRDGRAFLTWLSVYAIGRFSVELLRADVSRGFYGPLSTAQWVSVALLAIVVTIALSRGILRWPLRPAGATAAAMTVLLCLFVAGDVHAADKNEKGSATKLDEDEWAPPPPSAPKPLPAAGVGVEVGASVDGVVPPPAESAAVDGGVKPSEVLNPLSPYAAHASLGSALVFNTPRVPSMVSMEVGAFYRKLMPDDLRLEIGVDLRLAFNEVATEYAVGPAARFVLPLFARIEAVAGGTLRYAWTQFNSPFFTGDTGFAFRADVGGQYRLKDKIYVGATPIAFQFQPNQRSGLVRTWEPRVWVSVGY